MNPFLDSESVQDQISHLLFDGPAVDPSESGDIVLNLRAYERTDCLGVLDSLCVHRTVSF